MEIAAKISSDENAKDMIDILAKFTEIPGKVKLVQLSRLMYSEKQKKGVEAEFKNLLSSVPTDLVSIYETMSYPQDYPPQDCSLAILRWAIPSLSVIRITHPYYYVF